MILLLKAAFRNKHHFLWLIFSLITLFGLTIASQLEMVTIGVIANTSSSNNLGASIIGKILFAIKSFFLKGENQAARVIWGLIFVACFKGCFLFLSRYTTRILGIKISRELRQQYFDHIQTLSMSFYQKYNIGSLSTRVVGDSAQIALSINSWISNYIHTPFTVVTTLGVCFYLSWQLSLVIFVGFPIIVATLKVITTKVKKVTRVIQKNQESFASVLIDFLGGIQTVKIFSMEKFTCKKYRDQNETMEKLESKMSRYDLMTRPLLHFATMLCLVLILIFGLYFMHLELAEILVYCGLLYLFYEPIRKFADENANVMRGVVAAERLFEVLSIEPDIKDSENAIALKSFQNEITFEDVWFKYENDWVLKGMNFTVQKGETIAIVGATGSGKTTVLQLLPRLYEVTRGRILIDGIPLQGYTQASLRSQLSYVSQKPFLFNDTVHANITYGNELTDQEVVEASKKAHADEFIRKLPDNYDTHLAEMGKNLSGGQQQRLAIARALAKKAPILILDEATSSLDSVSENNIKESIRELQGEVTQIIVAHRLSTIEHVDKIIFMERGVKIAEGSIEQLLKTCESFREMWEMSSHGNKEKVLN